MLVKSRLLTRQQESLCLFNLAFLSLHNPLDVHVDSLDARCPLRKSRLLLLSDGCSHLRLLRRHDVGSVRAFFQLLSNNMAELVILLLHLFLLPEYRSLKESRLRTLPD